MCDLHVIGHSEEQTAIDVVSLNNELYKVLQGMQCYLVVIPFLQYVVEQYFSHLFNLYQNYTINLTLGEGGREACAH